MSDSQQTFTAPTWLSSVRAASIKKAGWLWFLFSGFLIAFSMYYTSQEHYIYAWDSATYFDKYISIGYLINTGAASFTKQVFSSFSEDYSYFAVLPLLPLRLLLGAGRKAYIFSVLVTYGIPSFITFLYMMKAVLQNPQTDIRLLSLVSMTAILLNPFSLQPLYAGYVDIVGMGLICFIYTRFVFKNKTASSGDYVLLGILLVCLFLARRWYGYWVVTFTGTFFIYLTGQLFLTGDLKVVGVARHVLHFVLLLVVFVLLLFACAPLLAHRALHTNYREIYSAFRHHPLSNFFSSFYNKSGPVSVVLMGLGVLFGYFIKKVRPYHYFLILQGGITLFIFTNVQNVLDHQYYQFFPASMYFIVIAIYYTLRVIKHDVVAIIVLLTLLTYGVLNLVIVYIPGVFAADSTFNKVFAASRQHPFIRTDLVELERLHDVLGSLNRQSPGYIYVLSYSFELNDDLLIHFCRQHVNAHYCSDVLPTSGIDKRDGFPMQLFLAKYIINRLFVSSLFRGILVILLSIFMFNA